MMVRSLPRLRRLSARLFPALLAVGLPAMVLAAQYTYTGTQSAGSGTLTFGYLDSVNFYDSSTAGSATLIGGSIINFWAQATAGSATITNPTSLNFKNYASAANASINIGAGHCDFEDHASAGSSTITVNGNSGSIGFSDDSTADSATVIMNSGTVDVRYHNGPLVLGAFSSPNFPGSPNLNGVVVRLGSNNLTVGALNTTTTVGAAFWDGGSLTKIGTGTLTLTSASNAHTGDTTVRGGTLRLGHLNTLRTSTVRLTDTGTLSFGSLSEVNLGALAGDRDLNLANEQGGAVKIFVGPTHADTTYSGALTGPGSLAKIGNGTFTLSGANAHAGSTDVSNGRMVLSASGSLPSTTRLTVEANATLDASAAAPLTAGALLGGGTLIIGSAFTVNQSTDTTFSGNISGSGVFTKAGTGTLTLAGASALSGTTRITQGALRLANADALARSTFSYLSGDAGSLDFGTLGIAQFGGLSSDKNLALVNADTTPAPVMLVVGGNQADTTYSGSLSGPGSVLKTGTGTLTLSGANTYTGGTSIDMGTLALTHLASFGSGGVGGITGPLFVASGATLDTTAINATANNTASLYVSSLAGSGSIAMGNGFLVANQATNTTWAGVLSGPGRLRKLGSGTLTLTGLNTYAAATFFNEGTILFHQLANFGPTGLLRFQGGAIKWASGNTADLSPRGVWIESGNSTFDTNGNNVTFANAIGNALPGALTKAGSGTLTLAADNTYTGGTTISGGSLQLGNGGTSGSVPGTIVNNSNLTWNRSDNVTWSQAVSGAGVFTKAGSGTLTLDTTQSYTGGTILAAGTLHLAQAGALGSSGPVVFNGGTMRFSPSNTTDYSSRFLSSPNQAFKFDTNGQAITLAGNFSSAGGSLTKLGAGTLTLAPFNDYTGGTTVAGGTLIGNGPVGFNSNSIRPFGSGTVTLADAEATLLIRASTAFQELASPIVVSGGTGPATIGTIGRNGYAVYSGALTLNRPVTLYDSTAARTTFTGVVSGNVGTLTIAGAPGGRVTLEGANTFNGNVSVANGVILQLSANGNQILPTASGVDLNDSGLLWLVNHNAVGSLRGGPSAWVSLANGVTQTSTLTVGANAADTTFAGTIANGGGTGSAVALNKIGAGTLTLTGANLHGGGTRVDGGTLRLGDGGASGSVPGNIVNHANLVFERSDEFAFGGAISGTGSLAQSGSGTLTLSAANSFTGATRITTGTLLLAHADALAGSTLQHQNSDAGTFDFGALTSAKLGGLSGDKNLALANSTSAPVALTVGANHAATSYSGALTGPGALIKTGTGVLTLGGDGGYTGGTTIQAGSVIATHRNALGQNGSLAVAAGATLDTTALADFSVGSLAGAGEIRAGGGVFATTQSDDTTFAGVLSGAGRLAMNGTGTLTLSGDNTFTAATFANAGTIVFSQLNNLGQGANFQFNGGTLKWAAGNTADLSAKFVYFNTGGGVIDTNGNQVTFANPIGTLANGVVGTGGLRKTGAGTLVLAGDNTYTGATTVSTGTLQLGAGGASGSVAGDIVNHAALAWNRSDSATFARVISGPGNFTKTGPGTLTLTGANSYTGATNVADGALALAGSGRLGATPVTLLAGSTLDVSGVAASDFALSVGLAGTGTLAASGKTVTVSTAFRPGALAVTGNLALGAETATTWVAAASPGTSTAVTVNGTLALKGSLEITPTAEFDFAPDQTLVFATATAGITPGLSSVTVGGIALAETSPDVWTALNAGLSFVFTESTATLAVSARVISPLQAWRDLYFPTEGNDGTGIGADSADPDRDGLANLVEYATHTSPIAAGVSPVVVGRQGEHLTLTFPRVDDPALRYTVEGRDDLASGAWTAITPVAANNPSYGFVGSVADQTEIITETVIDPVSLPSRPRRFLRLSIDFVP